MHRLVAARALVLIAALVATAAHGQTGDPPLVAAQRCYGAGDLGCVLRVLTPDAAVPDSAPLPDRVERWRLLAFAAARLDKHDVAQRAFGQWLSLEPAAHLDRATTPPVVWNDYAAAWLLVHGGELGLQPVVADHPQLAPPVLTPRDWPKFAPPPRSGRDQARDFVFAMGPVLTLPGPNGFLAPQDHLGVLVALSVLPLERLRVGGELQASRWRATPSDRVRGEIAVRAGWTLWAGDSDRIEAIGGAGVAIEPTAVNGTGVVAAAGLRMQHHAPQQALGWAVQLADHVTVGGGAPQLVALSVALVLRPAKK